jgi:hypothetical protein
MRVSRVKDGLACPGHLPIPGSSPGMTFSFVEGNDMIYELRVYHCVPGRLPDLLKRFDTITLNIWKKYGIEQAGFWTVLVGESNQALYYLLKFDSLADREKKWNAFQADPEWHAARAKTEENGPIVTKVVNSFLQPTSFSSVK